MTWIFGVQCCQFCKKMILFCRKSKQTRHGSNLVTGVCDQKVKSTGSCFVCLNDFYYDVIISFTVVVVTLGPFKLSLISRRKTDKFWVNLSLFLVSRFLSIPSIRLSNQVTIAALLSAGCDWMTWSRSPWKYSSFNSISPRRGLDMDHWFRQSSNMIIFKTVDNICWRISGLILMTATKGSFSGKVAPPPPRDFLPLLVTCLNR